MKQNTYCIVSRIPEEDPLFRRIYSLREQLESLEIPQHIPNLGWHVTEVPPFQATEQEIDWLSLGLTIGDFFKGQSRLTRSTVIDIFESEAEDALILRLETDEFFKGLIERIRVKIHKLTDIRYPPVNFEANFHVTIGQGKNLGQYIKKAGGVADIFKDSEIQVSAKLPYPAIMQKHSGYWAPVMS